MKYLKILPLLLLPLFAAAQPLGTWPVQYGDTPPTHTPSGSGTRIYLNISTNELYNWNPAPVSSWVKYPKGFDQISGCAAPGYTPTARQSVFAVNSCTALQNGRGPELYQYTGSQWVCLNCYPSYTAGTGIGISSGVITNTAPDQTVTISGVGITPSGTYPNFTLTAADQSATNELNTSVYVDAGSLKIDDAGGTISVPLSQFRGGIYSAGAGISLNTGTGVITNTGDLSTTNELNTAFSVTGGNLRLTDPGGNLDVPVSSIAPVQAVSAGSGISISGTTTRTITAVDVSATNELQTISISGSDLTLSNGGGTVTLPGGGASDALGMGFTAGGGSGTIPENTSASYVGDANLSMVFSNSLDPDEGTKGIGATYGNGDFYGRFGIDNFEGKGRFIIRFNDDASGKYTQFQQRANDFSMFSDVGSFGVGGSGAGISVGGGGSMSLGVDGVNIFTDASILGLGLQYANYYPDIETNDNSLTSTKNVNALKQTPVSYTNAAAPNNTIFYSTTDSKLSYKDPGGTVHSLY